MSSRIRSLGRSSAAVVLAGLVLTLATPRAGATVIVPRTVEEMAQEAACIVRGKVVSSQASWDEQHQHIYTTTQVEVLEQIHGPPKVPKQVSVRTLGGSVGDIGMRVAGTEEFTPGEEVLVFLRPDPLVSTAFQVIGMSQGKYHLERDQAGSMMAVSNPSGLAFARPDATGVYKVDSSTPAAGRVAYSELKARITAGLQKASAAPAPKLPAPSAVPGSIPPAKGQAATPQKAP